MRAKSWATGLAICLLMALLALAQQPAGVELREMFLQLDANGDTAIEKDEVPESGQAAFQVLLKHGDTDKNGRLEVAELRGLVEKLRAAGLMGQLISPAQRFKLMDKDGDGKVTREEFPGQPAVFERIDANGDGNLTLDEVTKAAGGGARPKNEAGASPAPAASGTEPKPAEKEAASAPDGPAFGPRFKAMDKDGDGKITREEFGGGPAGFDRLDRDQDGVITPQETAAARARMQDAAKRFQELDKDGDGKLSSKEFPGGAEVFERLDADKDGFLAPAEAARAAGPNSARKKAKKAD